MFDLGKVQRKLLLNFSKPTVIVFCLEPRFFDSFKHFQKEESRLKMNLEAEDLYLEKPTRIRFLALRWSVDSHNDRGRVEFDSQHRSSSFHQELGMREICAKVVPKIFQNTRRTSERKGVLTFGFD
ncbi:hypothetical protein J6590_016231 [Homalodisca vitripennis]|nr:hypothetical protein J6590_016231 [Homalodisca vitripennis]